MLVCYGSSVNSLIRRVCAHGVLFIYRHIYRLCLDIPLWRFGFRDSIPSKGQALKFYHATLPACSYLADAVAADLKLNAFKRLPVVALLDERQRVFLQRILYFRLYVPSIVPAYGKSAHGSIQCIPIGRSNFLNIIRSGRQVCKQRLAVFVGLLSVNRLFGGGSVLIKSEHRALQRIICASCLGYAYAALIAGVSPCQSYGFASKADSFWQVVYGCSTVSLYFHGNGSVISSVTLRGSFFDYKILPGFQPGKLRSAAIIGGFLCPSG